MGTNFDLQVSIHPNPENIFMVVFIGLAYSPLNSAKLSCSSEVTLYCMEVKRKKWEAPGFFPTFRLMLGILHLLVPSYLCLD